MAKKQHVHSVRFNLSKPDHQRAWDYLHIQSEKGFTYSETIVEAILGMADKYPHKYARTPASNFEAFTRDMLSLIWEGLNNLEVVTPTMPIQAIPEDNETPMSESAFQLFASFEDDDDEWD